MSGPCIAFRMTFAVKRISCRDHVAGSFSFRFETFVEFLFSCRDLVTGFCGKKSEVKQVVKFGYCRISFNSPIILIGFHCQCHYDTNCQLSYGLNWPVWRKWFLQSVSSSLILFAPHMHFKSAPLFRKV